jgi:hypothetical protein
MFNSFNLVANQFQAQIMVDREQQVEFPILKAVHAQQPIMQL